MSIDRTKDARLKSVAGMIAGLSFRDMRTLAEAFDAKNDPSRTTAERLLAVADDILGPDYNPNAPTMRGGIND